MSKITPAALPKKHCSNTASKTRPAKSSTSKCSYKKDNLFHYKNSLSVTGERVQLSPLPLKTTAHLNSKHGNLGERAIVLELYMEERESGLASDDSRGIRWSRTAVRRLKAPSMIPYRLKEQVHEENTQIFDECVQQKKLASG